MKFTTWIRNYIGYIVAFIGTILLVILTYGGLGELFTDEYWENVGGNLSSISALTLGLLMIQVSIKQGLSEQALSAGLNTKETKDKYTEHKDIRKKCNDKQIYLPYFLQIRNERETKRRKREFLVDNNFKNEASLFSNGNWLQKHKYNKIRTNITVESIKWTTTEIVYTKNGAPEKLDKFRTKRAIKGVFVALISLIGVAFITGGLFLDKAEIPFWQKTVKLLTYFISIGLTVIFDVLKNYEKGAFGVPNELEEINGIWEEFFKWSIPEWVKNEVALIEKEQVDDVLKLDTIDKGEKVYDAEREEDTNSGTNLQEEPAESENV